MKRTRIRPLSDKRAKVNARRREIVARLRKQHPWCQHCLTDASAHPHEPWSRGRGGPIDDARNIIMLCVRCHDDVHENPEWAEKMGLLIPAHEGPKWLERGGVKCSK